MGYKYTDRKIEFLHGGQLVSTHAIFEDEDGNEFVHEPGVNYVCWHKLEDYKKGKTVHNRAQFLIDGAKKNNTVPDPQQMAEAYKQTSANQRTVKPKPLNVFDRATGQIIPNNQQPAGVENNHE